jgi:hypothetical protein
MPKKIEITLFKDYKDSRIFSLLVLLVLTDIVFIILHLLHSLRVYFYPDLSLEQDLGFSEIYQYVKEFWIAILFVMIAFKRREIAFNAWALVFFYFLLDDALQIHEYLNDHIAEWLNLPSVFGLRPKDLAEILFAAVTGFILLVILLVFYRFGSEFFRKVSQNLFILISFLIFFGLVMDMLHNMIKLGYRFTQLLGTIEDGGELIVMSFIVAYVYFVNSE